MPLVLRQSPADATEDDQQRAPAPHFVCLGAQKAGTQWLYDQATSHPDMWMPPVKEMRFLAGRWDLARQEAFRRYEFALLKSWRGTEVDIREVEFLRRMWFDTTKEDAGDTDVYRRLFEVAGSSITGDVSPQYALIGRPDADRILKALPDTRFVFMVREPVSRVWSQVCMMANWSDIPRPSGESRVGGVPANVTEDPDALAEYIRIRGVVNHSFQSQVIERWAALAGDRFAAFLMDDMIAVPTEFRRAVFGHIGLDGDRCAIAADHNRKDQRRRFELTAPLREVIEDYLGDERSALKSLVAAGTIHAMPQNIAGVRWVA